jgi:hypothetical protein
VHTVHTRTPTYTHTRAYTHTGYGTLRQPSMHLPADHKDWPHDENVCLDAWQILHESESVPAEVSLAWTRGSSGMQSSSWSSASAAHGRALSGSVVWSSLEQQWPVHDGQCFCHWQISGECDPPSTVVKYCPGVTFQEMCRLEKTLAVARWRWSSRVG